MRSGAKMMLMTSNRGGRTGRSEMEMGYGGSMEMGYGSMNEMEARRRYRRDSRGRFRSEMEGYGEMDGGYGGMESRRGYGRSEMEDRYGSGEMEARRGYGRNEMREEMRGYPNRPFPVYEDGRSNMNPIGFNPNREVETDYRMNATHHYGNEMERRSSPKMGGGAHSDMSMPMTREMAEEWVQNMKNEDGSHGPHWDMEKVQKLMKEKGIKWDPNEFYAILNALYSDYCKVMKKHGVESDDLYVDLAYAWLNDHDARTNKAFLYYDCIVK